MGNYMETCMKRNKKHPQDQKQEPGKLTSDHTLRKDSNSSVRVKVVLTKAELEWLLLQLKKDDKGRTLEQVLGEIEKSRLTVESVTRWKPCLESIMELEP
ncbi:hypothetical protein Hanom_Chr06g00483021 [Helianthus anomalus]